MPIAQRVQIDLFGGLFLFYKTAHITYSDNKPMLISTISYNNYIIDYQGSQCNRKIFLQKQEHEYLQYSTIPNRQETGKKD